MDEIEKLKVLVKHWCEHNKDHTETYGSWARKMREAGNDEAYRLLEKIQSKSREMNQYFDDLEKMLS